jgi:biopolymer transport protein TolR
MFDSGDLSSRPRRTLEGDLDITPMIDVTFLLLIFFMVSSTMQSRPDLDLPVASHSLGVDAQGTVVVTLLAGVGAEPAKVLLGDGRGDEGDLDDVRSYITAAVSEGRRSVVIKAEGDVSYQQVNEVARTVASVEGAELFVGVGDRPEE